MFFKVGISFRRPPTVPSGSLAKASFVGAKTVKGPSVEGKTTTVKQKTKNKNGDITYKNSGFFLFISPREVIRKAQ